MNKNKNCTKKLWMRLLAMALCLVLTFGTTVTIMAASFDGDLDGDGQVTAFDAQLLAEYQAGNRDLDPATVIGLTVRGILDRVLGLIVDDPVEDDGNVETTVEVRVDENGFVTKELTFTEENVTVTVPVGVKVTGTELTLTVTKKVASEGGVTAEEGQELLPMDIHVEGVAADNTVALIICVAGALDTGLNLGNLTVYHVENGELVAMTQVTDIATLSSHNSFYYDPVTGDVTIAMATFSEVALVADEDKAWQGMFADAFAGGAGTENDPYLIANADQLAYMSKLVSNDEEAASAHYKLIADVNLNGIEAQKNDRKDLMFYPIGYWAEQGTNTAGETYYGRGNTFTGTFDGNGNTIANIYQNTWLMDGDYDNGYWNTAMGLFGAVWDTTIKNLTMDNFQCDGETAPVGCIATYAGGPDMVFENIQLTNSNPRTYNVACGGIAGYNYNSTSGTADKITFRNITVDQTNKITALWGTYGVSGGSLLGRLRDNSNHDGTNTDGQKNVVYMENCHMATIMDVNNDCCSNYQWYLYCYAGMVIGTVDYIDQVPEVGIEDVVTAVDCTVTYGDWNEYWYCELVKNTIASYTHDHQFGRLTEITDVSEIQDENGNWNQEGGFVIANADNTEAECFHIFKHSEGYLYRHFHDVADETNPDVYETTDVDGDGVIDSDLLKEDHQCYYIPFAQLWIGYNRGCSPLYTFEGIEIKDGGTVKSAPKFAAKDVSSITTESTVKLSDLFEAVVDETRISKSALNVFVSPVGEDSTVSAVYAADNGNWGNGTLTFSGKGAAKIVITDYFYCTETVLNVSVIEMSDAVKFEKAAAAQDSYETETTVTVGELFTALQDAEIDAAAVQVTVSAAGNDSTAAGEYVANTNDWTQGTLTFSGVGAATITITDNNYCVPTVIEVEITDHQPVEKFVAKAVGDQVAGAQILLGDLFDAVEGAQINSADVAVTVSGAEYEYVADADDWKLGVLKIEATGSVTVTINDQNLCNDAMVTFDVIENPSFTTALPEASFLYRVGSSNAVALGKLFSAVDGATINGDIDVTATTLVSRTIVLSGSLSKDNWETATIEFEDTFTGPVQLTIDALGAEPYSQILEVVSGNNVTANASGVLTGWVSSGSNVLLEDVAISSGGTLILANGTFFGNGFTLDAKNAAYAGVDMDYKSYVINMSNANMDNVVIEGAVYPELGTTKDQDYYRPLVFVTGTADCRIANSYLSNTASPIRSGANLELVNTTLKGGAYANLDMRGGQLILDNVTTINQVDSNDQDANGNVVVGMGVVVYQEGGSDTMSITIKNNLTQYNYLSQSQANTYITDTFAQMVTETMFGSDFAQFQYSDGTTTWVNTGIISMNNYFQTGNLVDQRSSHNYSGLEKTVSKLGQSRNCYVYTVTPTGVAKPDAYTSVGQYSIAPVATPDFTTKNYKAQEEGSNDYCITDNGAVKISMDVGDTFNWDTDILTVEKNGESIPVDSVTMNGVDYKGKSIPFSQDGTYSVVYTYSDSSNYALDEQGNLTTYTKTYTKTILINVVTVEPDAQNAVFSFGASGTAYSAKTVTVGDKLYVMPDVSATVSGKIGSTTVDGTTVYYPITEMYTSDGKTSHSGSWYACFPIFKDALQIVDYADKGTGDSVTYNQSTVTTVEGIPSTLKAVNPTKAFLYSMNATNYPPPTEPSAVNGAVCYTCNKSGLTASNERNEMTITAEYTYTDNAGTTYYFYIGYHCAEQTKGTTCVTGDTLITLAGGSQVRVDALTGDEMLLVWNHTTGKLEAAPIAYIVDHDKQESLQEIIHLYFDDGSDIKVISEHVFYDATLNKYVTLDENAADYIGHTFVGISNKKNSLVGTKLTKVVLEQEVTTSYEVVTYQHLTCFTNGVLSASAYMDKLLNIFDINPVTMAYMPEMVQADIATYGLYTYADFEGLIEEEAFELYNAKYLKIAVGKGYITWEDILDIIDIYFHVNVQPLN